MAVSTTTINGDIFLPTGAVREKSFVIFEMTGFDTSADNDAIVVPYPIRAAIADDGSIDVELWPNPIGIRSTLYNVTIEIYDGYKPKLVNCGKISVPATSGPYDLNDLLPLSPPADATVDEYIAYLAAAVAEAEAAAAIAVGVADGFEDIEESYLSKTHFTTLDEFKTAIIDGFTRPNGARVEAGGVEYTALSSGSQFDGLPGWAMYPRDSDQLPRGNFAINDYFGGAYKTLWGYESTDETTYTGGRSTVAISRVVDGSGQAGVGQADVGLHVVAAKNDLYGATPGEVDAVKLNVFSDGHSDAGGILIGAYKHVGDGTIDEGGLTPLEVSSRRFTTDLSTYEHLHQSILGFSPNPQSAWSGRDPIGFYSENHVGDGFANFLGITDGATAGSATMQYLIAGFGERDLASRYFSVDSFGNMESKSYDDDAAASPIWSIFRDSETPASNDLIGRVVFRGRNDAGEQSDYFRISGAVHNAGDGIEDGQLIFDTLVDGTTQTVMTVRNGVSMGSVAPVGVGSLSLAESLFTNNVERIDAEGVHYAASVEFDGDTTLAEVSGSPEGVDTATLASMRLDTTGGNAYIKTSPTGNEDWERLATETDISSVATDVIAAAEFITYTEGTFTPTLAVEPAGDFTATYTATGSYTRIGNRVRADIRIVLTSVPANTSTGDIRIGFAGIGLTPINDLADGRILRKPAQINLPLTVAEAPLNIGLSVAAGDDYATITYSTLSFGPQTLSADTFETIAVTVNLDFSLEFSV